VRPGVTYWPSFQFTDVKCLLLLNLNKTIPQQANISKPTFSCIKYFISRMQTEVPNRLLYLRSLIYNGVVTFARSELPLNWKVSCRVGYGMYCFHRVFKNNWYWGTAVVYVQATYCICETIEADSEEIWNSCCALWKDINFGQYRYTVVSTRCPQSSVTLIILFEPECCLVAYFPYLKKIKVGLPNHHVVCESPLINFWMPELSVSIMAPEPIATAYFTNPSQPVCVCSSVCLSLPGNGSVKTLPRQRIHMQQ
jgi:hypothetical protein